jgi:hypothetical protein
VGPRADVDAVDKRKNSCPSQESNPRCPAHGLVVIPTELSLFLQVQLQFSVYFKSGYCNLFGTSRPRPRVAVALPGDCLAVNVRMNDIVTFLDVTKLR